MIENEKRTSNTLFFILALAGISIIIGSLTVFLDKNSETQETDTEITSYQIKKGEEKYCVKSYRAEQGIIEFMSNDSIIHRWNENKISITPNCD